MKIIGRTEIYLRVGQGQLTDRKRDTPYHFAFNNIQAIQGQRKVNPRSTQSPNKVSALCYLAPSLSGLRAPTVRLMPISLGLSCVFPAGQPVHPCLCAFGLAATSTIFMGACCPVAGLVARIWRAFSPTAWAVQASWALSDTHRVPSLIPALCDVWVTVVADRAV
jgi:hypothetical protein